MRWFCFFILTIVCYISCFFNGNAATSCNFNSECRQGFVCIGGTGDSVQTSNLTGTCQPMIALRQVCLVHNFLTNSIFAYAIIAVAVIFFGLQFFGVLIGGRVDPKTMITIFVSVIFILGSYQVIALLIGKRVIVCESDFSSVVGGPVLGTAP